MPSERLKPISIELFSGAGGLALGLRRAGFSSLLAVEASPMAAETYFRNFHDRDGSAWAEHLDRSRQDQIWAGLAVARVGDVLGDLDVVRASLGPLELDLLAGGPPCQGFSTAGKRDPSDGRNALVYDFLTAVRELNPRAVLIENVAGMGMHFAGDGDAPLAQVRKALSSSGRDGYITQILDLNARDFGVPQHRPRVMILGLRRDLGRSLLGRERLESALTTPIWSSSAVQLEPPPLAPTAEVRVGKAPSVSGAIGDLTKAGYRYALDKYPPEMLFARTMRAGDRSYGITKSSPDELANHDYRRHGPRVELRFKLHVALAAYGIRTNLFAVGLADMRPSEMVGQLRRLLRDHRVSEPLRLPDGTAILDSEGVDVGVNHPALAAAILSGTTRKHSQRALRADQPAATVMSLPDDFVHYAEPRTLTVREMARLQSFPDAFTFYGNATTGAHRRRFEVPQYTQVGNAVPPLLAAAVARHLAKVLARVTQSGASVTAKSA